jgi:hypothetical protein
MTLHVKSVIEKALGDQHSRKKETMLRVLADLLDGEDAKVKQAGMNVIHT